MAGISLKSQHNNTRVDRLCMAVYDSHLLTAQNMIKTKISSGIRLTI